MEKGLMLYCTVCGDEFMAMGEEIKKWETLTCPKCHIILSPKLIDRSGNPIYCRMKERIDLR